MTRRPARRVRHALFVAAALPTLAAALLLCIAGCGGASEPTPATQGKEPPEIKAQSGIVIVRSSGDGSVDQGGGPGARAGLVHEDHDGAARAGARTDLDVYATVPDIPLPQTVGVDLRPSDRITVREALTALLVKSANDAALTLPYVAGSEDDFTAAHERARRRLGLTHTHFVNCRGTPKSGHHSIGP